MARSIVGARIRERRRQLGITQAELARRCDISPSYLNLIERNKRGIAGKLLARVAGELSIRAEELDGAAERRLFEQLQEISADPRLAGQGIEPDATGELLGRFPGWARAISMLARSENDLAEMVRVMSDRLTHDPFLGEAVHRMLTHTASLRSAAEILTEVPDIEPEERRRFEEILAAESRRLSDVGEGLAAYFDRAGDERRAITHTDAADALFEARSNHFAEIEAALDTQEAPETAAATPADAAEAEARIEAAIDAILDGAEQIDGPLAADAARARLRRYAIDAAALPLGAFTALAAELGYDMELLAARTGAPVDRVCRRLATLPPTPGRPRFGYVATNAAGVVAECLAIPGLAPARHGGACPLWINFRASALPGQTLRQRAVFPTGLSFVFVARARPVGRPGFGQAALHMTDLLALDQREAQRTVYGSGQFGEVPAEPVGTSCRICPREDCAHRLDLMAAAG